MQSSFEINHLAAAIGSTPARQGNAKCGRSNGRRPKKKSQLGTPITEDQGGTSGGFHFKTFLQVARVTATVLRSLVDVLTLELVKGTATHELCLEFSSKSIQWVIGSFTAQVEQQAWRGTPGQYPKDLLVCVKSSVTYAAKLLYLGLKNSTERAPQFLLLANHLLDLIALSESWFGSKAAISFLAAVRSWLPDLLIAVSFPAMNATVNVEQDCAADSHTKLRCFNKLVECGRDFSTPWVANLATVAFQLMEPVEPPFTNVTRIDETGRMMECSQDGGDGAEASSSAGKDKVSSFSENLMISLSKLLQRGDPLVLEGIINILLMHTALSLNNHDYSSAAGALDLIYRRLLGCQLPLQIGIMITLKKNSISACEEINNHLDMLLEALSSERSDQNLSVAKQLVAAVLFLYRV